LFPSKHIAQLRLAVGPEQATLFRPMHTEENGGFRIGHIVYRPL
jgi:hypothetical protein